MKYIAGLIIVGFLSIAVAGDYDIDPTCLVSFDVVDKQVNLPPWTNEPQQCDLLEFEREKIFLETIQPLLANPTVEGIYASSALLLEQADLNLVSLQAELAEKGDQYDRDKTYKDYAGSWNKYVIVLAVWSCSGGPNPGCITAVLGTAWATNAYFRTETSVKKLETEITKLRNEIATQKNAINDSENTLPSGLKAALTDFHSFCFAVKEHCLTQ